MNKIFVIIVLSSFVMTAGAQLKVTSAGKTGVVLTTPVPQADLSVGNNENYNYSNYSFGLWTRKVSTSGFNIGIRSYARDSENSNRAIGVQGIASGGQSGWSFGVLGGLEGTNNGAGIFGTLLNHTGIHVNGRYAGYFDGATYVKGTMTATSYVTTSDIRLKENVRALSETVANGSTLENVLNMNVISYNYIDRDALTAKDDTASASPTVQAEKLDADKLHYGLSAQELQQLYPDLVYEGQDGYLGVNYVELVPILIRSIQELKAELDEVKGADATARKVSHTSAATVPTALTQACLYQNTPNPFSAQTEIRFSLPDDAKNAYIYIFDMTGKMQKQIAVDPSMQSVTINGYELQAGIYLYSLVVGGQEIDTKRMILSK